MRSRVARVFVALSFALVLCASGIAHADDLDARRERFREGLERYNAGQFGDAIVVWEDILKEIGTSTGYRLAFNLGRAYEAFGSPTRAAERYELFLTEVHAREMRGESVEALVIEQRAQAEGRVQELSRTLARIRTEPTTPPTLVQIDVDAPRVSGFLAYVQPGRHRILQKRGAAEAQREIDCVAGKTVELEPLPAVESRAPEPAPRPPISPAWLFVAGGATVASFALPIYFYTHALSVRGDYGNAADADKPGFARDYDDTRSLAYKSWVVPAVLGATTGALTAYYFYGPRKLEVRSTGAGASITARF